MLEHLAKSLSISLFFLNALKDLPENDFNQLCMQSLQVDFLDLPIIQNELLSKNLATSYYSQSSKDKDTDHKTLKRWKITSEGEEIFKNLPLHLTTGSKNFLLQLIQDYQKKQEENIQFEASIKPSPFGEYLVKLKQFENNICTFSVQFLVTDETEAQYISSFWLSKESFTEKKHLIHKTIEAFLDLQHNRNRYDKERESFNHDP